MNHFIKLYLNAAKSIYENLKKNILLMNTTIFIQKNCLIYETLQECFYVFTKTDLYLVQFEMAVFLCSILSLYFFY